MRRFDARDTAAIARLNTRLQSGGALDVVYPEGSEQNRGGVVRERMFVADDDGEIRGAVWLREQPFRIDGADVLCGWLKYPVAESLVDPRFSGVPASLIIQCLREQPRLLALGLGGHQTPLARMLQALKWMGLTIPLVARVVRPGRVLRRAPALRRTPLRAVAADVLAWTGVAAIAFTGWDIMSGARRRCARGNYIAEPCQELGTWADDVWQSVRDRYPFIAARDARTVDLLQPDSPDIQWLRVRQRGTDVGWVSIVQHDFAKGTPDHNFGTLRVGLIADALAAPEHARGVLIVAMEALEAAGVDVILSNQLHQEWAQPLRDFGCLNVTSNFALYASPQASRLVRDWTRAHVNRGDCDGPLWYRGRN